jgi:TolB protein
MNADGTGKIRLTFAPGEDVVAQYWPDGTKIAFASKRDGNFEIYVMNANGSGQTNLTNNPAVDWGPAVGTGRARNRVHERP